MRQEIGADTVRPVQAPFRHSETLRWNDADLQGVVNNSIYLTLFEQARFSYFRSLGILDSDHFPFLLGSTSVRFERPLRAGDSVQIETRTTRLGGASFDMSYQILRGEERVASGSATLVWVDDDEKSVRIPDPVRERLRGFEGPNLED